jgi:hypothetical protein
MRAEPDVLVGYLLRRAKPASDPLVILVSKLAGILSDD